jgi:predicted dehydrogenase
MSKEFNRREFIGLGTVAAAGLLIGCETKKRTLDLPPFRDQAPDGPPLKAGLIGCGGRGTGAAVNYLTAGPNLKVTMLVDLFPDRIASCRKAIKEQIGDEIPDENCLLGFDEYKKVIESDVDIIILATPPHFRPEHFVAAIEARKHVFMEKPVAVDPVGARSIIASSKKAEALGLVVGTGTQRRHQRDYVATYKQIYEGAIGDILSANCYWNSSQLWYKKPQKEWTEMEYMIRDWVNWTWLSGDHIVEQHVHNIDVINWFTGLQPKKAVGFGARHRRVTGDQYDFFSIDFEYENSIRVHSMCRQIDGCQNNVSEYVRGTEGYSNCRNTIFHMDGSVKWQYEYPKDEEGKSTDSVKISPYVQEHIDLVTAIRENSPYTEAENTAISTMAAIMGRISAYTGKETSLDEMMGSNLILGPKEYNLGPVDIDKEIPVPGTAERE